MDTSQVKTIFNPLSTICCRVASLWSSKFNSFWFLETLPGPCISVGHSFRGSDALRTTGTAIETTPRGKVCYKIHTLPAVQICRLSFDDLSRLPKSKAVFLPIAAIPTRCGSAPGVAMLWTITMAPGVEISTSPWQVNCRYTSNIFFISLSLSLLQWRDHWLPCVQLYSELVEIKELGKSSKLIFINYYINSCSYKYTLWTRLMAGGDSSLSCCLWVWWVEQEQIENDKRYEA